jgi:uncharacterized membrane protein
MIVATDFDLVLPSASSAILLEERRMIRWVLVIFFAVIVFSALLPWLEKLGIGRLPGDLRFKLFGRIFSLPFASTILISLVVLLIARFL